MLKISFSECQTSKKAVCHINLIFLCLALPEVSSLSFTIGFGYLQNNENKAILPDIHLFISNIVQTKRVIIQRQTILKNNRIKEETNFLQLKLTTKITDIITQVVFK